MLIKSLKAREILDSRGVPTIEAVLETDRGLFKASVPSGTSRGRYEAIELRDGGTRFFGKGVLKAVGNIEKTIASAVSQKEFASQKEIDDFLIALDGTPNKSNLGANAILAVSVAFAWAFACECGKPLFSFIAELAGKGQTSENLELPKGCFNILEGGRHAGNDLEIQEFMIVPHMENFAENLRASSEIYYYLKIILVKNFGDLAMNTGYESGFAPALKKAEQALDFLMEAINQAGYEGKVRIGLDIAASELLHDGKYKINGKLVKPEKLLDYYLKLLKRYPILFLEDPFGENDFESWQGIISRLEIKNSSLLIMGDDLTATNPERIKMAQEKSLCNAVIIKPNQIGTVWEAITAAKLAKNVGWKIIVSHRAGETTDDFIADLAVGLEADFIKSGAPAGGERVVKYNRLLEIEQELNDS
ncbi:MAG: enolase [Candidatus Pacebacteria bacterium]|nr:enolase [Candidatus Paceibacterota bacterium]